MANTVDKVIAIAEAEVGYLEKATNKDLDSKTGNAGSNNYTKYWRDMAPGMNGQYWCLCFTEWCFVKAYGEATAKKMLCTDGGWSYYTPTAASYFKTKGQWYTSPQVGDEIFFKNSSRICHVGLVYKVDASYVYTIEGNTSSGSGVVANGGAVAKKKYALNNSKIAGYGRPKYDGASATSTTSKPTTKSDSDLKTLGMTCAKQFIGKDNAKTITESNVKAMVLQVALNKDYKAGLVVDGAFGPKSKAALKGKSISSGAKNYLVTAAELLCYLNGKNPNGVEIPGLFGKGLANAIGATKVTEKMFLDYIK